MEKIITSIHISCQEIYKRLNITVPTLSNEGGVLDSEVNTSGDIQKPLDIITDNIISNQLSKLPEIAGFISEEREGYHIVNPNGKYIVCFDPLDGSGNSSLNLSTGSIFCIFKASKLDEIAGDKIVGAVYSIYGPTLEIITVTDTLKTRIIYPNYNGILSPVVIDNNMSIPSLGKIYVANEGNYPRWSPKIKGLADSLKGRSLRWMACFVADIHRLLMEGGVYMYPSDSKQTKGKLRLLYEVYPMAYIWERCGGYSLDEKGESCLDITFNPNDIHERTPILLFGREEYHKWMSMGDK